MFPLFEVKNEIAVEALNSPAKIDHWSGAATPETPIKSRFSCFENDERLHTGLSNSSSIFVQYTSR